jgi:hypothetical protein
LQTRPIRAYFIKRLAPWLSNLSKCLTNKSEAACILILEDALVTSEQIAIDNILVEKEEGIANKHA